MREDHMSLNLRLVRDDVTPDLMRLLRSVPAVRKIAGMAMRNALISHFRAKNATPNRLGGARTNFWVGRGERLGARRSATGGKVVVSIRHPHIATHVYGRDHHPQKSPDPWPSRYPEGRKKPALLSGLRAL